MLNVEANLSRYLPLHESASVMSVDESGNHIDA